MVFNIRTINRYYFESLHRIYDKQVNMYFRGKFVVFPGGNSLNFSNVL